MKLAVDMASILNTCLAVGKDTEGYDIEFEGKKIHINTAAYGYEHAVNSIKAALDEFKLAPIDLIMVSEGMHSKSPRLSINSEYKATRAARAPEHYKEYEELQSLVREAFKGLGAIEVSQPYVEGDDILAWLAANTEEDLVVMSNDGDLVQLHGTNAYGANVQVRTKGEIGRNPYGDFDCKLITTYKALVGDTSDNIKGCKGFGAVAFLKFIQEFGEDGLQELQTMLESGSLRALEAMAEADSSGILAKIFEQRQGVLNSYFLAKMYPEWVDTIDHALEWYPGMCLKATDERLKHWGAQQRLVTAENYTEALKFFEIKLEESPFVTLDLETTTGQESDDWLTAQDNPSGVDVIGSRITGCGLTFGRNTQYSYYISVEHKDTGNCTLQQLGEMLSRIPPSKVIPMHNAAGFELPVLYQTFAGEWGSNGWRGFIPNGADTRIMATHWDENEKHGLKHLSKLLLGYEQESYESVTTETTINVVDGAEEKVKTQHKMHELTAKHVFGYGVDDVVCTAALYNFFSLFMKLEHTYDAYWRIEQKPMYLSALSFVQGTPVDIERLKVLEKDDEGARERHWEVLSAYLTTKGWDGVNCPVYEEITPAAIKEAVKIVTGQELVTMVRTLSKLSTLLEVIEGAELISACIDTNNTEGLNRLVKQHYKGKPDFNTGSPKQITKLLYETMGLPIRLRNKATDSMRARGIREGNPRSDDDAIGLAIKMGDVKGEEVAVLRSLLELKSITTRYGLYWKAWPNLLHWKTGRLHPSFRQSGANSRRFTASSPNLQQMDSSSTGVRSAVLPHTNTSVILSLDWQAQEIRQVGDLSRDEALHSCFVGDNLRDTHSLVAHLVDNSTYEEFMAKRVSKDELVAKAAKDVRDKAKVVIFANLYGAMAPKIAETLGISEAEAQTYLDRLNTAFPKIAECKKSIEELASSQGWVPLQGGTRRHLRKLITSEDNWEATKALRQAFNASIQGSAANQAKIAMSAIWDSNLPDLSSYRWYFSLHDETVHSCEAKDAKEVALELHKIMCHQFLETIPSMSSVGVGRNYGQLREIGEVFTEQDLDNAIKEVTT